MYNQFYGFSEDPFELTPNPRFLYLTRSHREALSSMTHGIKNRDGFISVTGEVGTGKTILIHSVLDHLGEKVKSVHIFHTTLTFNELLRTILSQLHLAVVKDDTTDLLHQLTQCLHQMRSKDEMLVIIIDEAQDLPLSVMKDFQTLIPLGSKGMKIVFVGQPGFEEKLESEGLEPLKQSIEISRRIKGFSEEEAARYIEHRLRLVGKSSSEIFPPETISLICRYSRGNPRVINILCENALLMGYRSSQKKIDTDTIRGVIKNLEGPNPRAGIFSPAAVLNTARALPFGIPLPFKKSTLIIALSFLCLAAVIFLSYESLRPKSADLRKIKSLQSKAEPPRPSTALSLRKTLPTPQKALPSPQKTAPLAPLATTGREYSLKKIVAVKKGETISRLAQEYYGMVNLTLIDLLLELNPAITDVNLIVVDQEIKVPNITEALLIVQSPDRTYRIHAGTFENLDPVRIYGDERALKGKNVETLPRKVSPRETWHRVLIGNFDNKEEVLKMTFLLKEKGLLPAFGGLSKY